MKVHLDRYTLAKIMKVDDTPPLDQQWECMESMLTAFMRHWSEGCSRSRAVKTAS